MLTELQRVKLGRRWYYVDERLAQIRNVDNPHDCRSFPDDWAMWEYIDERVTRQDARRQLRKVV